MIELLKLAIEYQKEKRKTNKHLKLLKSWDLDYEALRELCSQVQLGHSDMAITVYFKDGTRIVIENKDENGYKSFAERYAEAHK